MNENINLIKILKDCPKGTKFYSYIFGDETYFQGFSLTKVNLYQLLFMAKRRMAEFLVYRAKDTLIAMNVENVAYSQVEKCMIGLSLLLLGTKGEV